MCDCKIKDLSQNLGTKQMKRLKLPVFMSQYFLEIRKLDKKELWVDKCLADEIKYLWSKGITTTGCCCGHNFKCPYIGVTSECSDYMKKLGYTVQYNPFDPNHDNEFYPKSIKVELKYYIRNYLMRIFRIKK